MATYQSNYCYFTVYCTNTISGTYPNIKHDISFSISITATYGCQWNGAVLNFGGKTKTVNVNVGAGTQHLWSDSLSYSFDNSNRSHSVDVSFSTSFGNVSAKGSQTETATIGLPKISSYTLKADAYNKISYSASLSSNPYDFYTISAKVNDSWKQGTSGSWSASANTSYTAYYYVVAKGKTDKVLTTAVTKSVTTPKPNKPSKGTVSSVNITHNSARVSWNGFTAGEGASISKYQYSSDASYWTDTTNTYIDLSGLSSYSTYRMYIRAVDNYSQYSDYGYVDFTTLKPSKPIKGSVSVSDITPFGCYLSWSGFSVGEGATSFYYQYSVNNSSWIDNGTYRDKYLNNLIPESNYSIKVRIVDNFGTCSDSSECTFTTLVDQIKIPVVIDGKIKPCRMWMVDNGIPIKTKKAYVVENGMLKKITNDW